MASTRPTHVLCAIEPNAEAKDSVQIAATFAESSGGDITLLHVVPPMWQPYADLNFTPVVEAQVALEEDLLKSAKEALDKLAGETSATIKEVIVKRGTPVHDIVEHAEELQDALIVMGVHNRRGLRRLMGSTAHGVLNATDKPILLTHADEDHSTSYDNVVIAVDTSEAADGVFDHATPFVEGAKEVHVITVVPSLAATMGSLHASAFSTAWPLQDMQGEMAAATKQTVTETAAKFGINADAVTVIEGDPAHEICMSAEQVQADLIIMGAGQRNIVDRILLGSTAHGVLNNTPCDVYIARG